MRLKDRPLAKEIAVVLVIKLAAIAVIWGVFFNPDSRPNVGPAALGSHLLPGPALTAPESKR